MERLIFHVDVNNAFLSWAAIDMLKGGSKLDIRNIPAVVAGDEKERRGVVVAKSYPAKKAGIKAVCISPKSYESRAAFNEDFLKQLNSYHVDLVVLAGFLVVIPPEMIKQYRNRIINIHPSLIPSFCGTGYYGLKVHEGVLARGVKVTGATCHFVDEGTDTGPIILQKAVEVKQGDTPEVLQRRVMEQAEWKIMPHAIDLIANGRVSVEDGHVIIDEK